MEIEYYIDPRDPLQPPAIDVLKAAKQAVFGDRKVTLKPSGKEASLHLDNTFLTEYPLAQTVLERRFQAYKRESVYDQLLEGV